MTATLEGMVRRRRAALRDKLDALALDFNEWEALSAAKMPFEKHHTQVRRLVRRLGRLREVLDEDIGKLRTDGANTMTRGYALERDVLLLHNMWEFYRSRFAQRFVPWMKHFLDAADDYAWACLQPMITAAVAAKHVTAASVREPPLTFLNGEWSPFASTRGTALMTRDISPSETERQAFIREVKSLPLSVLGLPWYQLSHLPDVLMLAHEIGHVVEDDLNLTESLTKVLSDTVAERAIPANRASAWEAWLGEAFADTFGAVAGGRGFGCALADFVTLDVKAIRAEALAFPNWGVYPTTALRLRVVAGALDALGDADGVKDITDRADALMDGMAPMAAFHDDCAPIARAWLEASLDALGKRTILEVARVPITHWAVVEKVSAAALRSKFPLPSSDVRALVSGARLAFETEPDKYRLPTVALAAKTGDPQAIILAQIEGARTSGVRASKGKGATTDDFDDAEAARQVARFSSQSLPPADPAG
jgi:hypothetical protein